MRTFKEKVKALSNVGHQEVIASEDQLEHELDRVKDADPEMYEDYLNTLRMSKKGSR